MATKNYFWLLLVAFVSVFCWQAAYSSSSVKDEDAELYRMFVDVVEHVDRSYVKPIDRRKLVQAAIRGMLEDLDPYSDFIAKEEKQQFDRTTTGHFGGVGISVDIRGNEVRIVSPMVGTPAYDAGIRAGDRIIKVDGHVIERFIRDDVVAKIAGPPGTSVTLTIQHAPYDKNPPQDLKMNRQVINIESVRGWMRRADEQWNFTIDDAKKIAYVRLGGFTTATADDLTRILRAEASAGRLKGLIMDLRNNPGGLLPAAIKVSDLFVKEGKIVSTKGRGQTSERVYNASASDDLENMPMAVLVNRFSASASEIVSACLQDHNRAVVIGERTWGKGSVQNVIDLEDGKSAIKLTVASYNRPNGHNIHRFKEMTEKEEWGVTPNAGYELKWQQEQLNQYFIWRNFKDAVFGKGATPPEKQPADFKDGQLDKALEYVRGKIGS